MSHKLSAIADLYVDGFRNMTWGRPLWGLIILKIVILFLVLRLFFFKPVLAGKTDEQKSDFVGMQLIEKAEGETYDNGDITYENTETL
ncbi:MAG: DUF4492 domain-containing protein [Candidatus Cryptobacteroides sp.]